MTSWPRGRDEPRELVEATGAAVRPSDAGVLFFSSGSTSKPKGILSAHRGVSIQMWRFRRLYRVRPGGRRALLVRERLLLVRQFRHVARLDPRCGRLTGAATDLRRRRGARAYGRGASELPVRLAAPVGAARGRTQLGRGGSEQHAVRRLQDPVARHPTVSTKWFEPGHAYGNTETFTITTNYPANTPPEVHAESSGVAAAGRHAQDRRSAHRSHRRPRRARGDLREGPDTHAGLPRHAARRDARRGRLPLHR